MGASASALSEDDRLQLAKSLKLSYEDDVSVRLKQGLITQEEAIQALAVTYNATVGDYYSRNNFNSNTKAENKNTSSYNSSLDPARLNSDVIENIRTHKFLVGDIVKVNDLGMWFEGVLVSLPTATTAKVDVGDEVIECQLSDCILVKKSVDLEVGDKVEFLSPELNIYFVGHIIKINNNGTYDIKCFDDTQSPAQLTPQASEHRDSVQRSNSEVALAPFQNTNADEDIESGDIERGVKAADIRKLMTGRELSISRIKRIVHAVAAIRRMSTIMYHK